MEVNFDWAVHLISLRSIGSDTVPQMLLPITRHFLSEGNYYWCVLIRQLFCNFIFIGIYVCLHKIEDTNLWRFPIVC